jgi:hypothetical protein
LIGVTGDSEGAQKLPVFTCPLCHGRHLGLDHDARAAVAGHGHHLEDERVPRPPQPGAGGGEPSVALEVLAERFRDEREERRVVGVVRPLSHVLPKPERELWPFPRARVPLGDDVHIPELHLDESPWPQRGGRSVADLVSAAGVDELLSALEVLAPGLTAVEPLAGDASHRRFFRVGLADGGSLVACLYPPGGDGDAAHDHAVQSWGFARALPIPRPLGLLGRVTASEDVGEVDLLRAASTGVDIGGFALEAMAAFQETSWDGLPTPPFDAPFFRRELAGFERFAWPASGRAPSEAAAFLDGLALVLAAHPGRLTHRDFHANNLFLTGGRVVAVDFQDMRGGPDTYDAASLLRERGGDLVVAVPDEWLPTAATRLEWTDGWRERFWECAAQRGLKVIGTFMRLASEGRTHYGALLPEVRRRCSEALEVLGAPFQLLDVVVEDGGREREV